MSANGRGGGGQSSRPPAAGAWLLRVSCSASDRECLISDLAEEFEALEAAKGRRAARRWYRGQVAKSVLPLLMDRVRGSWRRGVRRGVFHDLGADVRYGLRRLASSPVQVVVTVVSLGIGIGLVTSVFAVANAFLMRSADGVTDTDGLVAIYTSDERGRLYDASSYPDLRDVAAESSVFRGLTAIRPGVVRWTEGESSRRVLVEIVNGGYFDVLGVKPRLGRFFWPDEVVEGGAAAVTVVSYEFWQDRLGGDGSVLGRAVRLDGRDFTVIGVAPEGLLGRFLRLKIDAWVPIGLPGGIYHSTPAELVDRGAREYMAYGRLAAGLSIEQAQARLNVVASRLRGAYPEAWVDDRGEGRAITIVPAVDARIPPDGRAAMAGAAGFLLAGAALILLIACINVAGLFLARALQRRREISVRLSLGAGRGRVVRLLLVEALVLALAGGVVGTGLATFTARFLSAIPFPIDVPLAFDVDIGARVLLFAIGTALATCLAFGLAPALRASRTDLVAVLKADDRGGSGRRLGLRGTLVTAQVAGSLLFLVGAGLCLRSTAVLADADPGISTEGIAIASWMDREEGLGPELLRQRVLDLSDRLAASPQVASVEVASVAELSAWTESSSAKLDVDGFEPGPDESVVVDRNVVTPGYFEMLGMRPVRGRLLTSADDAGSLPVALVNEAFVRAYWPGESGIGGRFTVLEARTFGKPYPSPARTFEVVGVLPDVVPVPDRPATPYVWTSFLQDWTPLVVFHVRSRANAVAAVPDLRRIVQDDVTEVPLVPARTYADLVAFNTLGQRIALQAFAWSGAFALLLAVMGIYAIVSFAVSRRLREMAIRQAVGADRGTVLRSVVMDGLRLAGIGAAIGLCIAVPAALLARSALYGISPVDPLALGGALGVLLLAAFAATLLPARRAALVDPVRILREE